jgi:hypothetical protein
LDEESALAEAVWDKQQRIEQGQKAERLWLSNWPRADQMKLGSGRVDIEIQHLDAAAVAEAENSRLSWRRSKPNLKRRDVL